MNTSALKRPLRGFAVAIISGVVLLLAARSITSPVLAEPASAPISAELAAMIDRAAIENLFAEYYSHYGAGPFDYSQFYAADGVLDVDGLIAKGQDAIRALYASTTGSGEAATSNSNSVPPGRLSVQLTNLKIEVGKGTAHAEMFWNCILTEIVVGKPKIIQYGQEQTDLIKQDGRWVIHHRVTTRYGGMPTSFLQTYVMR